MLRPRWIVAITVSAATAAVVGCGGGGSQSVSAAELVQKADAICGTERTSYDRVQAHPPPNAKIAAAETDELIRATDDANSKLRDLKPPHEVEAAYDRYLEARNRVVGQMKRGKDAAESQDSAAYGAAQAAVAREAPQRRKLAVAVGLKVCSSSSGSA